MTVESGVRPRPLWGDLSVQIDRPDGTTIRWAGDELDAANIPCDLQFGSSMPGGFKGATATLFRAIDLPGREGMFDDLSILGPGQEVVWQGRLQQMPTSTDSGGRVTPQAVGWSAHLEDDATFRQLYVDRELAGWGGMPLYQLEHTRTARVLKPGQDGSAVWDSSEIGPGPMLDLTIDGYTWTSAQGRPWRGIAYTAPSLIGSVEWRWNNPVPYDGNWGCEVNAYTDGGMTVQTAGVATLGSSFTAARYAYSPPAATMALLVGWRCTLAPGGSADSTYPLRLAEVAVYGQHTVPGTRTDGYNGPGTGPYGYRASDVLPDVLAKAAPLLRFDSSTITPTDVLIRQLTFGEPCTAAAVIEHLNRYHLWDWAVWEDRTFYWRPRGSGRTWTIATADGLDLSLEGDDAQNIYNGIVVTYTDYAGTTHTVGPPGSGAEREDVRLISADINNPATVHGIRRWRHESMSVAADHEIACTYGQMWLGVQAQATRRGSATIRGTVYDDAGQPHPAWRVRGGDTLIVTDRPDDPPRRIIETSYTHRERSNQLTLDSTAATADALIERLVNGLAGVL